jgi:hypothetical protein
MDVDVADELVVLAERVVQRHVLPIAAEVVAELVAARVKRRTRDAVERSDAAVERSLNRRLRSLGTVNRPPAGISTAVNGP